MATESSLGRATRVGLRNVGSYQVAGHPYMTGSVNLDDGFVHMIAFPYVSRAITVINTSLSGSFKVHFHSGSQEGFAGSGGAAIMNGDSDVITGQNFIEVPAGHGSLTMDVKTDKFFISTTGSGNNLGYQVFAELTSIPTGSMYTLTGSGVLYRSY